MQVSARRACALGRKPSALPTSSTTSKYRAHAASMKMMAPSEPFAQPRSAPPTPRRQWSNQPRDSSPRGSAHSR
eukprot:7391933-Prymnesium_polylepis.1